MKACREESSTPKRRAWVGVVSRAHVLRGIAGGFAQLCHGKQQPLARMRFGDWLVYYSPSTEFGGGAALRAFTAIGQIVGDRAYEFDMGGGFVPFRRNVSYETGVRDVAVSDVASKLHFIQRNQNWGMLARRGHFEIDLHDFQVIAKAMRAQSNAERCESLTGDARLKLDGLLDGGHQVAGIPR